MIIYRVISNLFLLSVRGVYREAFTGVHVDRVYMNRGTPNLYTMWTPFGDTTIEMGGSFTNHQSTSVTLPF
jgi:hypothetical protein